MARRIDVKSKDLRIKSVYFREDNYTLTIGVWNHSDILSIYLYEMIELYQYIRGVLQKIELDKDITLFRFEEDYINIDSMYFQRVDEKVLFGVDEMGTFEEFHYYDLKYIVDYLRERIFKQFFKE